MTTSDDILQYGIEDDTDALAELYRVTSDPELSFDAKVEAVLELGRSYLGAEAGFLTSIEAGTQTVAHAVGSIPSLQPGESAPLSETYCQRPIDRGETVCVANAGVEGWDAGSAYERFGLDSYIGTPVAVGSEQYGTFCFASREPRTPFSEAERTFVELLAQWVAYELTVRRRETTLDEQRRRLETVTEHVPVVLFAFGESGTFTFVRGRGLSAAGLQPEGLLGENVFDLYEGHEAIVGACERALAGEEVRETQTVDGVVFETWYRPVLDGDEVTQVVGVARDVTDRKARERELRQTKRAVDVAPVGVTITDPSMEDNPIVYANDAFEEITGYSTDDVLGRNCRFLQGEGTDDDQIAQLRQGIEAAEPVTVELRNYRKDGEEFWNRVTVAPVENGDGEVVNYVGFQEDVTERKRHEEALTALHHTTRELLRSEGPDEVARRVADAGDILLESGSAAVYLFDDESALVPAALGDRLDERVRDLFPVEPDSEDPLWKAFLGEETVVYEATEALAPYPFESAVLVPLGDHGLLAITAEATGFDDRLVELVEVLAANAEVVLDRLERERTIRDRDAELRRRADRLAQLDEVNERVRQITHDLVGASTREQIQRVVCEGLADSDRFELVCLGKHDGEGVEIDAWAGAERGYLDTVDLSGGSEPTVRAATGRERAVVDNVAGDLRAAAWRSEALSRGVQSVLSLPLERGGVPYGVLSVYAGETGTFDAETSEVLTELGRTVAHAIRTVERRQALSSDRQVELAFDVTDGTTPLFVFSDRFDCELDVERLLTRGEHDHLAYATVSGLDAPAFREAIEEAVTVADGRVLSRSGDGLHVELQVHGPSLVQDIVDNGGAFRRLTAHGGDGRVSTVFPSDAPVGRFIESFVEAHPEADLAARRERARDRPDGSEESALTARQREVLEAAVNSGFFEWPRESAGQEIADVLDIAPPTFQEHLRHAERKVMEEFLDRNEWPGE